jgi:hypothetical protein
MPSKKKAVSVSKKAVGVKWGQLKQRTDRVHCDSPVVVSSRDTFGFPIRMPVRGVRITMNDDGKPDYVEIVV